MAHSESGSGAVFDLAKLRQLVELMKEYDLSEMDLCEHDQQIRLCRGSQVSATPVVAAPPAFAPAAMPAPAISAPTAAREADSDSIVVIKSPMVGTFYSRPNPNAEAFVKVGSHVEAETTICIIEAMKVFNEIPAEVRGQIVGILVDDEEPVEFGKPLFKVDTRK